MNELTHNVNWLAVIIGAVAVFILGWLWYSPKLFGLKWAEGVGVEMPTAENAKASPPPIFAMLAQAFGTFLLAWVVGISAAQDALLTIIVIVLTIVTLMVAGGLFSQKSRYAITTEAGFVVAMAVVMMACQAVI